MDYEKILTEKGIILKGIYFIAGDMEVVKIGRTGNLKKRISEFNTMNDRTIKLIGFIEEESKLKMLHIEKMLHYKFNHLLKKGEWFYLTDEIMEYIEENDL